MNLDIRVLAWPISYSMDIIVKKFGYQFYISKDSDHTLMLTKHFIAEKFAHPLGKHSGQLFSSYQLKSVRYMITQYGVANWQGMTSSDVRLLNLGEQGLNFCKFSHMIKHGIPIYISKHFPSISLILKKLAL